MPRLSFLGASIAAARNWLSAAIVLTTITHAEPGGVVINEIMYHPPADREDLQYIELFNAGTNESDLSGWSFSKGVKFVFPAETRLPAGEFLVVCRDRTAFTGHYGREVRLAGEFKGHLGHGGERVEILDATKGFVDAVEYTDSTPWPMAADGHSSSLERISPLAGNNSSSNWAASNLPEIKTPAGTPGRVNDSFSSNLPPIISDVTLMPALPAPGRPTTIGALVADADGLKTVKIFFQVLAPKELSDTTALPMKRVSGDIHRGRYEAILPAQPEGRVVRYWLEATDSSGAGRSSPMRNELRAAWSYSTFVNHHSARVPVGFLLRPGGEPTLRNRRGFSAPQPDLVRRQDAFIYIPSDGAEVQLFDFVRARPRNGGFKVHFLDDQTFRGMTSINIIFEGSPRYLLAEALAYDLYRLAGVPAELTEHVRLCVDGKMLGYHLLIEQPNKSFLRRHERDPSGNLYKLIWYGNGVVGKHEKKTNLTNGHDDLLALIDGLNQTSGAAQWALIQKHFNVEEFASYFAASMCIQNWDGFHNNYFVYHDTGRTGRWEIYPWDEDKTWGDYDGASARYDWYSLPLTYAMNGSERPESLGGPAAGNSFVGWWRAPGYFSGPMLANPQFRERFLLRLREVCTTIFTEKKMLPLIDAMEKRLEGEVLVRAEIDGKDPGQATARFRADLQSFRQQVTHRRKFILAELDKRER